MIRRFPRIRAWLAPLAVALAGPAGADGNFSQYPGFAGLFAADPPSASAPDPPARRRLQAFRPRFHLPPGHPGPIDFYLDYVAHGTLYAGDGGIISGRVDTGILNRHGLDPAVTFVHRPGEPAPTPVAYGREDHAVLEFHTREGVLTEPVTLLTYHLVFAHSGLPAGLPRWQAFALGTAADLDDWHQLDHYTAVTVVLDAGDHPFAVMFQQHNYGRTYLLGETVDLPPDGRLDVDVAVRSNELYPHRPGRQTRRAVRFADRDAVRFLMGFGTRPGMSADDVTEPVREVDYRLHFLPPADAFYQFRGYLGERRALPGRDGPPGADFNTLPVLKPWTVQLFARYWREGSERDLAALESSGDDIQGRVAFARHQSGVFHHNRRCLASAGAGCLRH